MATERLNELVAERLREAAALLEQQGANPFRVAAFRRAANTVDRLPRDARELVESGNPDELLALPGVGRGIAGAIVELVVRGRWTRLERLRGELDPERLFQSLPGIGPELARRIHDTLHVDTLEGLEAAAHDGRLESVPGVGHRRATALRAVLASMLGAVRGRPHPPFKAPGVDLILDVDAEYRRLAEAGALPTIAPRRFNPDGEAWLALLHTERGTWHFTAMFSNTARAHELGHTRDWVVIYFYDDHHQEGQHTVVTETRGALVGRRVVRGREAECRRHYLDAGAIVPSV